MRNAFLTGLPGLVSLLAGASGVPAAPLGTSFTVQGKVTNGGPPLYGLFAIRFSLYDAATGGNLVAGPIVYDGVGGNPGPVPVSAGNFTAKVDFGPVYDGTALWLHVEARPHTGGAYIPSPPRQPLNVVPFALWALNGTLWSKNGDAIYYLGDVGIGTDDPQFNLHLLETVPDEPGFQPPVTFGMQWVRESQPPTEQWLRIAAGGDLGNGRVRFIRKAGSDFIFGVEPTFNSGLAPQVTLSGEGFLGIGTTAPVAGLHVVGPQGNDTMAAFENTGDAFIHLVSPDNNPRGIRFSVRNSSHPGEIVHNNGGAVPPGFQFRTGGFPRLFIHEDGDVGVGTTDPDHTLDVGGTIRADDGIYFNGAFSIAPNDPMNLYTQDGNLLSFGHPGTSEDYIAYSFNNFYFRDSPGGGDATNPSLIAEDFITWSDIRLKKNVEPVTAALDKVLRLKGIRYQFDETKIDAKATVNNTNRPFHIGFSAQNVAEVAPEAIHRAPDDTLGVSYGALIPLVAEAIKEQQTMIDTLRNENEELKARLTALEQLLKSPAGVPRTMRDGGGGR